MAHVVPDVEAARDEKEYLQGYSDFSYFIASDYSLSIYRKFGVLGARNLLYLQGELQLLELQLAELDDADKNTIGLSRDPDEALETEKAARSWEDLIRLADEGNDQKVEKLRIIYRIRKLMKEYGWSFREHYSETQLTLYQKMRYFDAIKFFSLRNQKRNLSEHLRRGSEEIPQCCGEVGSDYFTMKKI
jgi:hypothetical protein